MTDRFGSMATQNPQDKHLKFTQPGDVYWDLFRVDNQNRSSGNKEALWVIQYDVDVTGGNLLSIGSWGVTNTTRGEGAPYQAVIGSFKGDWITAAEIYREWALQLIAQAI